MELALDLESRRGCMWHASKVKMSGQQASASQAVDLHTALALTALARTVLAPTVLAQPQVPQKMGGMCM